MSRPEVPGEDVAPVPLGEAIAAVGEAIAAHARIRSLRRGVLTIAVDAAPWATQLRYVETEIVARATVALGAEVREARIVVEATPEAGRAKRRNERA